MISSVTPQLRTLDIESSIRFYTEKLGFTVDFRYEDFYAGIRSGAHAIHLKESDCPDPSVEFVRAAGHFHLYLQTDDVDAVAQHLRAQGVVLIREPADTPWNTRELVLEDDQGHTIYVGERLDGRSDAGSALP
jgi:catechol 2,3-dioxygenase-like lactoylglutathione lyase family enzyme